jgi:zinc protease
MPQTIFQHTLDNGLAVLLRPLETSAAVSTWIFYRVGARNEVPGQTGISHWVEHMAFKGTESLAKGEIARQVHRRGGSWNGFTQHDWTAYFETLPAEHWELALRIEAERMSRVLLDRDEVEAERTVVIAEREGAENEPAFLLHEEVVTTALRVHPYRQPIIGWKEDLYRISYEDLLQHYQTYYTPNNAVLVVVGAIDPKAALKMIAKYFAAIPAGPPIPAMETTEPLPQAERHLILRRPGSTPIIEVAFPSPRGADPDFIPFLVMDAVLSGAKGMSLFGGGPSTHRTARLYRALVETELAVGVRSFVQFSIDPGLFTTRAILRAGRTVEEVEPVLLAELERMVQEPPSAQEIERTVRQVRAQLAYGRESTTGQAYWLGSLALVDHPERFETLLDEVAAVRPEDIARIASSYLRAAYRTVGRFIPTEDDDVPAHTPLSSSTGVPLSPQPGEGRPKVESRIGRPPLSRNKKGFCALEAAEIQRRELPGGPTLLVRENRTHPVISIHGYVRAGSLFDPSGKEGLAQLTASMLSRGTESRTFQEIHETLEGTGAGLEFGTGLHATIFSGKSLTEDLPMLLELLVEMLRWPAFPEAEWQRLQGETLTRLHHLQNSTGYVADRAFRKLLYPEGHLYRRRAEGTPESVETLSVTDLRSFHQQYLHPHSLCIAVSGNTDADEIGEILGQLLAGWEFPPLDENPDVPRVPRPEKVRRVDLPIAGKSQVNLVWGVPGLARTDPDYYGALLANIILGRLGLMGRLGASVRDIQGLAYTLRSTMEAGPDAGPWTIRAGIAPQNVEPAIAGILQEIGLFLREGPTPEERSDAIAFLTGQLPLRLETNDGVAATLLALERFGLGLDFVERYPDILQGVTLEDIVETARRYLSTEGYALALAGPLG